MIKKSFRMVPLRELLTPVSRPEVVNPQMTYHILGAHWYAGGLYTKDIKTGTQIQASKLYRVEQGDFVYNRLFAWKGSFAIATEENHNCHVSNEFPCFIVNQDCVDSQYLWRYFSRASAWDEAFGLSTGGTPTSRNRLKEEKLLAMEFPLPPLDEQRRVVARIERLNAKIDEANLLRRIITAETNGMLRSVFQKVIKGAKYIPMLEVAPIVRRPVKVIVDGQYPELGIRSFGNGTFHKPPLSGFEVGSKQLFYINPGDLIFSNVFAWEGAIAVVQPEDAGRVGSHRFITCVPCERVTTPEFLCFYFLTPEGLIKIGEASPGERAEIEHSVLRSLNRLRYPFLITKNNFGLIGFKPV